MDKCIDFVKDCVKVNKCLLFQMKIFLSLLETVQSYFLSRLSFLWVPRKKGTDNGAKLVHGLSKNSACVNCMLREKR